MKPSRFTVCCRFFYLSLVGLWEITVIKPLLFYSEPLAPFISKNSSLHFCLPILVQLGWVHFPFPLFWWVRMRTGIWLSWSNPWWESCCCTGFSSHFCTFVAYPVSTWCLKKSQTLSSLLRARVVSASLKRFQWPKEEIFRKAGVCLHLMWYKMKSGSNSKM